jgi:hypothetical protein
MILLCKNSGQIGQTMDSRVYEDNIAKHRIINRNEKSWQMLNGWKRLRGYQNMGVIYVSVIDTG